MVHKIHLSKSILAQLIGVALFLLVVAPAADAAECTPKNNVDTILDDSGSMASSDPSQVRQSAAEMLIDKHDLDDDYVLSSGEFGTKANAVFSPMLVKGNEQAMKDALEKYTQANNGGTDYNLAFSQAKELNPSSQLRIFLSDGKHNQGTYNNGHSGGPETDTIGFSSSASSSLLEQIAEDTGGTYYENVTSSNLQAVVNEIDDQSQCAASTTSTSDTTSSSSSSSSGSSSCSSSGSQSDSFCSIYNVNVNVTNSVNISNNTVVVVVSWRKPKLDLTIEKANRPVCKSRASAARLRGGARNLGSNSRRNSDRGGKGSRSGSSDRRGQARGNRGGKVRAVHNCLPEGTSVIAPFARRHGRTYAIAKFRNVHSDHLAFKVRALHGPRNQRFIVQTATYNG